MSLTGKRIMITGGAGGMGAIHADYLSERGAAILIADIVDTEGEALAQELQNKGRDARYVHLDVTSEKEWAAAVEIASEEWGGIDGLVNNAGVTGTPGCPEVEDLHDWNKTVAVNQTGGYLGLKLVAPLMRESGGGSIVNVSSILGFIGDGDYFAYCATKGAVRSMARAAALHYVEAGIRVNSVCPGMVKTPMNEQEVDADSYIINTPTKRMAEPIEISKAVAFLLSDDASYVTGSDLVVDGGYLAR